MSKEGGITVWYDKRRDNLVLSWQCYACIQREADDVPCEQITVGYSISHVEMKAYQYVGNIIENKFGSFLVHQEALNKLEFIGMF